ncbi:MAG: ABC transporter permease, partial [Nocardioidaceae bacterium]|nr:ABC transporter permease [Nocardioidaceae bacterium]
MFLGIRELRFARGRFALVGAVIALIALLTTMLSGLANGLVDDGISGLRRLPMTNLVFQQGAAQTFSRSTLTDAELSKWSDVDGVDASALGVSFVNARTAEGKTVDVALFGVPEGSFLAPSPVAEDALEGKAGLVLSEEFQDKGIKVGDELTIVGVDEKLPVLGFTYAGSYGHVDIAFTSLESWQELLYGSNAKGRFSAIALRGSEATIADAAQRLDHDAGTETVTKTEAYDGSPGYAGETQTMTMIRAFLLVISALIVGAFFIVWTMQRTKQLA